MSDKVSCNKKDNSRVKRGVSKVLSVVLIHAVEVVKLVDIHTGGLFGCRNRCEKEEGASSSSHHEHKHESESEGEEEHHHEECHHENKKKHGCPIKYNDESKYWNTIKDVYKVAKAEWSEYSKFKDAHKMEISAFSDQLTTKFRKAM